MTALEFDFWSNNLVPGTFPLAPGLTEKKASPQVPTERSWEPGCVSGRELPLTKGKILLLVFFIYVRADCLEGPQTTMRFERQVRINSRLIS